MQMKTFKMSSSFSGFKISCVVLYSSTEGPVDLGALVDHDSGDFWGLGAGYLQSGVEQKENAEPLSRKMTNLEP